MCETMSSYVGVDNDEATEGLSQGQFTVAADQACPFNQSLTPIDDRGKVVIKYVEKKKEEHCYRAAVHAPLNLIHHLIRHSSHLFF